MKLIILILAMLLQDNYIMNKSIKAALLSALIFPGVGQISAGYKRRGWLFVLVNCVFLYLMISEIIQRVYSTINEIQKAGVPIDVENISKTTQELISFSDNTYLNSLLIILMISWAYAIFDAYHIAAKK